jgi:uridine kinase
MFWELILKLFSADADVRLARRIRRDTLERGRDVNGVIEQASVPIPPLFILLFHTLKP